MFWFGFGKQYARFKEQRPELVATYLRMRSRKQLEIVLFPLSVLSIVSYGIFFAFFIAEVPLTTILLAGVPIGLVLWYLRAGKKADEAESGEEAKKVLYWLDADDLKDLYM
jgi:hypothetical protein